MPDPSVESSPVHTRALPMNERIAEQAYNLWVAAGRPHGRSEEFWLKAELQVLGADSEVRDVGTGAVSAEQYAETTDANHAKANR